MYFQASDSRMRRLDIGIDDSSYRANSDVSRVMLYNAICAAYLVTTTRLQSGLVLMSVPFPGLFAGQYQGSLVLLEALKNSQSTLLSRFEQLVQLNCVKVVRTIDRISGFLVIFNGLPSHVGYCIYTIHGFIKGSFLHTRRQAASMDCDHYTEDEHTCAISSTITYSKLAFALLKSLARYSPFERLLTVPRTLNPSLKRASTVWLREP